MNLTGKQPMGQKVPREARPDYLKAVREMPCIICEEFREPQMSPTTAHHPIHGRFSQRKAPDITAIPLCDGHHQANFDNSKVAVHREPSKWRRLYSTADVDAKNRGDTEYIARIQDRLAHMLKEKQ